MNDEVLNSWKEIAAYLGRGVRTVQRWERELALPIRRPRGKDRSAVIALKPDIDAWLHKVPHRAMAPHIVEEFQRHSDLHLSTQQLLKRTHEVLERCTVLQSTVQDTLALTIKLRAQQTARMQQRASRLQIQELLPTRAFAARLEFPDLKPAVPDSGLQIISAEKRSAAS